VTRPADLGTTNSATTRVLSKEKSCVYRGGRETTVRNVSVYDGILFFFLLLLGLQGKSRWPFLSLLSPLEAGLVNVLGHTH
jgi:hypothetical protein